MLIKVVARMEFDPEGTEPTNEPRRLTIISNLFVFSNFLIPTATYMISKITVLIIFDHVTIRRFHCNGDQLSLEHMFLEHMVLEHMVLGSVVLVTFKSN